MRLHGIIYLQDEERTLLKSMMGVHHIGVVTDDWDQCHRFYVDVMGGKPTTIGGVYQIPLAEFQDDIFDAADKGVTNAAYGVPDFQSENSSFYLSSCTKKFWSTYVVSSVESLFTRIGFLVISAPGFKT